MSTPKDPDKNTKKHTGGVPKKGTPEYEAWKASPEYEALVEKRRANAKRLWDDSEFRKRREFDSETREKMSQKAQERWAEPEYSEYREQVSKGFFKKGQASHNKGKPMPEYARERLMEGRKNYRHTEEFKSDLARRMEGNTYAKGSKGHVGMRASEETRARQSAAKKNVKQTPEVKEMRRNLWYALPEEERQIRAERLRKSAENITHSSLEEYCAQQFDTQGIVYERQKTIGWYKVDFYIPAENRIVEVNGCYWHACEQCSYELRATQRVKDAKRYEYLRRKGYIVEVVWEHDIPKRR